FGNLHLRPVDVVAVVVPLDHHHHALDPVALVQRAMQDDLGGEARPRQVLYVRAHRCADLLVRETLIDMAMVERDLVKRAPLKLMCCPHFSLRRRDDRLNTSGVSRSTDPPRPENTRPKSK